MRLRPHATDFKGELEISAWELGAGCKDYYVAWQLNLGGLAAGVFLMRKRTWGAFVRGRRAQSLYGRDLDALLESSVGEARAQMGVVEEPRASFSDAALFALAVLAGVVVGLVTFAIVVPLLPFGLFAMNLRRACDRALT
ncbi:hypothetical protein BH09MYX1_BH09MYX1_48240 [soil metagenome]